MTRWLARLRAGRIDAGGVGDGADQAAEQIDVVDRKCTPCSSAAMRSSPMPVSIEGRGSGARSPGADLIILHEDEVPEFEETVAVLVGAAGRAAGDVLALVVENFRAGAAGADVAHAPEIVAGGDADDAVVGEAGDLLPQAEGLVVVVIDGDEQPVARQAEFAA